MQCKSCNGGLAPGDVFCGACGARVEAASPPPSPPPPSPPAEPAADPAEAARQLAASLRHSTENYLSDGQESVPKGCLVLCLSFFGMPFKTLRLAGKFLREISRKGALETESDAPHLMWFATAIPVVASGVFILTMVSVVLFALKGSGVPFLGDINPVFALIVGYLYAVFLDWGLMLFAEAFILLVRGSRDLRVNAAATTSLLNLQRSANEGRKETP